MFVIGLCIYVSDYYPQTDVNINLYKQMHVCVWVCVRLNNIYKTIHSLANKIKLEG